MRGREIRSGTRAAHRRVVRRSRRGARLAAAVQLVAMGALFVSLGDGLLAFRRAVGPTTVTFSYTGGAQLFAVPAGVTSVVVDVQGAQGGGNGTGTGGLGGDAAATVTVAPGQALQIMVGGRGVVGSGGYNGGGAPGPAGPPPL